MTQAVGIMGVKVRLFNMKAKRWRQLIGMVIGVAAVLLLRRHRLERPAAALYAMSRPMVAAVVLILLFSVYWNARATDSKPAQSSESAGSRWLHLMVLNAGLLVLIFSIPGLTRRFLPVSAALNVGGLTIECVGILLAVWARRVLGSNWSGEVRIAQGHQLVRSGPYRFIRHPMYTAFLAMYGGAMLVSGEWHALMGFLAIALAYLRKLGMEERILQANFGEEYTVWRQETWALLPPVY